MLPRGRQPLSPPPHGCSHHLPFPPFTAPAVSYYQSRSLDLIESAPPRGHDSVQTQGHSSSLRGPICDRRLHHFSPAANSLISTPPVVALGSPFCSTFTLPFSFSSDAAPYYCSVGSAAMLQPVRPVPSHVSLEHSLSATILQRAAGLTSLTHPSVGNKGDLQRYPLS